MSLSSTQRIGPKISLPSTSTFHKNHSKFLHAAYFRSFCKNERKCFPQKSINIPLAGFIDDLGKNADRRRSSQNLSHIQYDIPFLPSSKFWQSFPEYSSHQLNNRSHKNNQKQKLRQHKWHSNSSLCSLKCMEQNKISCIELLGKKKILNSKNLYYKYKSYNSSPDLSKINPKLQRKAFCNMETSVQKQFWKSRGTSWPLKTCENSLEKNCGLFLILQFVMIILFVFQIIVLLKSLINGR